MSFTKKIIENERLFNSAYFTVLSEFQSRVETPKNQYCVPFWDFSSENVKQDISEKGDESEQYLTSPEPHSNFSSVPNMYDINQYEVGMWLDCTPLNESVESYEDVDDLFDSSIFPVKVEDKIRERKLTSSVLSDSSSSIDDRHMDVNNEEELNNSRQSTLVDGNSKLTTNADMTLFGLEVHHELANEYANTVNDCKRDLTAPEKDVSTKRQCVDSSNTDVEKLSNLLKSIVKDKFEALGSKTKLENLPQLSSDEINVVIPNSLNNVQSSIATETRTGKKNELDKNSCSLKKQSTLPPDNERKNLSNIEKKCSELKSLQMKQIQQCEWRKKVHENQFNSEEKPADECLPTSFSDWLRNREQKLKAKMAKTTDFTGMMKNDEYMHKAEDYFSKKTEDSVLKKVEQCCVEKVEHCVAKKALCSSVNKVEHSFVCKSENFVVSKSSCVKKQTNELIGNKIPVSETPPKPEIDDVMVNLLVIGRNRNSELAVQRSVLERVRSRSLEIEELIPPVDSSERTINYSLDATITFLRCLFASPYNVSNWKIALEAISMAKVYNLPNLRDTCLQYFKKNFPHDDLDQVIAYARHFKIIEDFMDIEVFTKRNIDFSQDGDDKPRIFTYTCSISSILIIDPSEFSIPLCSTQQYMGSMFEVDIKNDLTFEAMSGMFCITGIQIKLKNGIIGNTKKNVVYSVTKQNKRLISDTKEKPFKSLIIINFNKKVIVKRRECIKISIMIEDIQPCLCYTTPSGVKLAEKTDTSHFRISLSSNKSQEKFRKPLFFIEKLFYTLNI